MERAANVELRIMNTQQARQRATTIVETERVGEWADCELLNNPKVAQQKPFAVCQESADSSAAPTYFYIVPYGIDGDHDKDGTPLTRLCILFNADTGEFEEVVSFEKPVAYLSPAAAIEVVASALGIPASEINSTDATPMFTPGEISHERSNPFWKVVMAGRAYYVDQKGKLYTSLSPGKLGS